MRSIIMMFLGGRERGFGAGWGGERGVGLRFVRQDTLLLFGGVGG